MSGRRPVLVVGEAITAFMQEPGDPPLRFRDPVPSGAPVIFASAAARLGAEVTLVAATGDDPFGDQLRSQVLEHGVRPGGLVVDPVRPTSAAFVSYAADGSRRFVFYLDGTASLEVDPALVALQGEPAWLHVSGATLAFGGRTAEAAWVAVERAIAASTPISLDPNVRPGRASSAWATRMRRLVACAAVILASEGELDALGTSEAAIVARGGTVCHKLGAAGVRVVNPDGETAIPAPAIDEVDPDGAGDILAAGFVAARVAGADDRVAAAVGVHVASESVRWRGPLSSPVPPLDTVLAAVACA